MNVIIANQYKDAISSLNIDVIKRMDGEFDIQTITDTFANFYFNRMILDVTALKDYLNIANIQKLSTSLDASKIILFLPDDPRINNTYLSKVISLGIYNFTKDLSGITYLIDNPNSYRDVAQYHDLAANDAKDMESAKNNQRVFNDSQNTFASDFDSVGTGTTRIIGFKDLTPDAGSTTLIYMLKKQLLGNKKVLAVEVNSNDFSYFNDSELMSVTEENFNNVKNKFIQFDIVLIDLNNSNVASSCNEVIYLLEPSTIKLNGLIRRDKDALMKIKDKKIVLNKSLLSVSDVKEFEYEAKVKMFYNIPPLDERKNSQMVLETFLEKMDIFKSASTSILDIFKK